MPLTTTANYDTEAAKLNKQPVWVIEIDTVSDKYTDGTFSGITASYKKLISDDSNGIDFSFQGMDFQTNRINPAVGRFTLIDKDLAVTTLVNGTNLVGKRVTFKHGYVGLVIGDFTTVYDYLFIDNIEVKYGEYTFYVSDPTFSLSMDLFRSIPACKLTASLNAAATTATVDTTTGFKSAAAPVIDTEVFFQVEDEIISYTGATATTFTGLTRARFSTVDVTHASGSVVRQLYVFRTPTCQQLSEIILFLLMTTDDGTNGPFDGGFIGMGAGIPQARVDVDDIREIASANWSQCVAETIQYKNVTTNGMSDMRIMFANRESAALVFEGLLSVINCCFVVGGNGKLTIRRADYFTFSTALYNIANKTTWLTSRFPTIAARKILNRIVFETMSDLPPEFSGLWSFEATQGKVNRSYLLKFTTSITAFREFPDKIIRWPAASFPDGNLVSSAEDDLYPVYLFAGYLWLFGDLITEIDVKSHMTNMKYTGGDVVGITDTNMADVGAGTRGITNEPGVIYDKHTNRTTLEFKLTMFRLINRLATIAALPAWQSPNDTALALSANDTSTTEAADAYIASPTGTYNMWILIINLTQPGSASSANREWVALSFWFMPNTGDLTVDGTKHSATIRLYYNRNATTILTYQLYFWLPVAAAMQRVKVDWIAASTAVAGDRPSALTFDSITGLNVTTNITSTRQRIVE